MNTIDWIRQRLGRPPDVSRAEDRTAFLRERLEKVPEDERLDWLVGQITALQMLQDTEGRNRDWWQGQFYKLQRAVAEALIESNPAWKEQRAKDGKYEREDA